MGNRKKDKDSAPVEIVYPTYTDSQLDEFDRWLEQYRETKQLAAMGGFEAREAKILNWQEAATGFGAMKKGIHLGHPSYAVIINFIDEEKGTYVQPTKMQLFDHKLEALTRLKAKREFAEKKRLEDYEKMPEAVNNLAAEFGVF